MSTQAEAEPLRAFLDRAGRVDAAARAVLAVALMAAAWVASPVAFGATADDVARARQAYDAKQYVDTRHGTGGTIASTGTAFSDSFATNVPQGAQMPFGMTNLHPVTNVRARDPAAYAELSGAAQGTVYTSHAGTDRRGRTSTGGGRERWEYYSFERARLKAFAVTAVSGTGCWGRVAKDFPFMLYPGDASALTMDVSTAGAHNSDVIDTREVRPLKVKDENPDAYLTGQPGYFKAVFNEARTGGSDLTAEFTTSHRSGIARFDLSALSSTTATVFFTTMSAMKRDASEMAVETRDAARVVEATTVNLGFCADDWSSYTIHMVAQVSAPGATVAPSAPRAISWNGQEIAVVLRAQPGRTLGRIQVKYGLSYTSRDAAYNNLRKEIPGWDFDAVKRKAQSAWNDHLGVVRIRDAEPRDAAQAAGLLDRKRVFYGSLYRAGLGPNLFSDLPLADDDAGTAHVDESQAFYMGFNEDAYNLAGHQDAQYQNFAGWDTYRGHSQLVSVLYRDAASDMAQSLVNNARQSNCAKGRRNCERGSFPQWNIANDDAGVMSGEPAAAMVASALAFGAADFDVREAYEAMVRGRDDVFHRDRIHYGSNIANRPANRYTTDRHGSPLHGNQGHAESTSKWLEIASATFAKAVFAKFLATLKTTDPDGGDAGTYYGVASGDFGGNAGLVTRLKGFLDVDGTDAATYRAAASGFFADYAQSLGRFRAAFGTAPKVGDSLGLLEGTAAQYLWSVPTDFGGVAVDHHRLIETWHADLASPRQSPSGETTRAAWLRRASSVLDDHLRLDRINDGRESRHLWFGNQVTHFSPWAYNFVAPGAAAVDSWRTQRLVRRIFNDMFNAAVDAGLAGNDDLGALSAWGVWAALGLYPAVPGLPVFTLVNPAFRHIEIDKDGSGGTLTILSADADYALDAGAAATRRYQYVTGVRLQHGSEAVRAHPKSYIGYRDLFTPDDYSRDVTLHVDVASEPAGQGSGFGDARTTAPPSAATTLLKSPSIATEAELDAFMAGEVL